LRPLNERLKNACTNKPIILYINELSFNITSSKAFHKRNESQFHEFVLPLRLFYISHILNYQFKKEYYETR